MITFIDLDLDVERLAGGAATVLDRDEFAERSVALDYPAEVVRRTEQTAEDLLTAVGAGTEPFANAPDRWLRMGRAMPA